MLLSDINKKPITGVSNILFGTSVLRDCGI